MSALYLTTTSGCSGFAIMLRIRLLTVSSVHNRVVADKAYETGIPQKLGEHANTARDTAAAKYNELSDQVSLSAQLLWNLPSRPNAECT